MTSGEVFAELRDTVPRMWWNLYQGAVQAGFDQRQAFALVQTFILAQNPNGIRPPESAGPNGDDE
jgi:hypothetical protein